MGFEPGLLAPYTLSQAANEQGPRVISAGRSCCPAEILIGKLVFFTKEYKGKGAALGARRYFARGGLNPRLTQPRPVVGFEAINSNSRLFCARYSPLNYLQRNIEKNESDAPKSSIWGFSLIWPFWEMLNSRFLTAQAHSLGPSEVGKSENSAVATCFPPEIRLSKLFFYKGI